MTYTAFEILMGYVKAYHHGMLEATLEHQLTRLYVKMSDVLASFSECPEEIAMAIEIEIDAIMDAAWNHRPIPRPSVPVIFEAHDDGTIIVACLRSAMAA